MHRRVERVARLAERSEAELCESRDELLGHRAEWADEVAVVPRPVEVVEHRQQLHQYARGRLLAGQRPVAFDTLPVVRILGGDSLQIASELAEVATKRVELRVERLTIELVARLIGARDRGILGRFRFLHVLVFRAVLIVFRDAFRIGLLARRVDRVAGRGARLATARLVVDGAAVRRIRGLFGVGLRCTLDRLASLAVTAVCHRHLKIDRGGVTAGRYAGRGFVIAVRLAGRGTITAGRDVGRGVRTGRRIGLLTRIAWRVTRIAGRGSRAGVDAYIGRRPGRGRTAVGRRRGLVGSIWLCGVLRRHFSPSSSITSASTTSSSPPADAPPAAPGSPGASPPPAAADADAWL